MLLSQSIRLAATNPVMAKNAKRRGLTIDLRQMYVPNVFPGNREFFSS